MTRAVRALLRLLRHAAVGALLLAPLAGAQAAGTLTLLSAHLVAADTPDGASPFAGTDVALPWSWARLHGAAPGRARLEASFAVPDPATAYGLYFARIGNRADVIVNGTLVARYGTPDGPQGADYAKAPRFIAIPAGVLAERNLLRIDLDMDGGRNGGLSPIVVGPAGHLRNRVYASDYVWRVLIGSSMLTGFGVLLSLLSLLLWSTLRSHATPEAPGKPDPLYLYAAAGLLCWSFFNADSGIQFPPLGWPAWGWLIVAAQAGWTACMVLLCEQLAPRRLPASWRWGLAAAIPAGSLASVALYLHGQAPWLLASWQMLETVALLAFFGWHAWQAWPLRGQLPYTLMTLVSLFNVVIGAHQWTPAWLGTDTAAIALRYVPLTYCALTGYIIVSRFRQASRQAQDLLSTLAARVADREAALRASYAQLEAVATERARNGERARILRDMHDGVGAHLVTAIRQLESGMPAGRDVGQTLRDALDHLKLSIDIVHLPPGDLQGLLANLRYRLGHRLEAAGIALDWQVDEIPPVPGLDMAAMRQLQFLLFEAISNVLQHAGARRLRIEAGVRPAGHYVRVIDDGCGFDPAHQSPRTLRERSRAIGAGLELLSSAAGTTVDITLAAPPGAGLERPQTPGR